MTSCSESGCLLLALRLWHVATLLPMMTTTRAATAPPMPSHHTAIGVA
jgi:hypothetical protein